ncbi:MAG TPA: response regulator transcription factor [Chloroflexota bacterium]
MTGESILVVDDEPAIRRTLRANLAARGYDVYAAETGEEGLRHAVARMPRLIILDLMLPGLSGLEVCRSLRAMSGVPILVLSARGEEATKIQALDLGADDYLTKPFGMGELLARVRALLRRPQVPADLGTPLKVGPLDLDPSTHEARLDGAPLDLTPREFEVLAYLMRHADKVITHRLLLTAVWGPNYENDTQSLRVYINRLRRKVEDDPAHPTLLITEPGVGYRLLSPVGEE